MIKKEKKIFRKMFIVADLVSLSNLKRTMISKLLAVKTYISNRKIIILGSLHGENDALFGFYQERFNSFSTLILIFINFGAERKHIIFITLLVQNTTDTH